MSKAAKKAPAKKKANGYKMPDPLPAGEVLQDTMKKRWSLGPSIGKGGFGEIYSAKPEDSQSKDFPFVIKIEPHENGPLFVEMHFYTRNAKEADITAFRNEKKLKHLGMPCLIGSGSHVHNDIKYRFIVMDKFASNDIWKLFMSNGKQLPATTVYQLGIQMLHVLEYIHSKGYVHADLKGANILLSLKNANHAYLVDFGLAGKFTTEPVFKPNPKKMHDGTIEYSSRDAHQGVQTRRGDIEVLAYNLIHWLCGKLPWETDLTDPKRVQDAKETQMKDIPQFLSTCFGNNKPSQIEELLKYINKMQFNEEPDYTKIKKLLLDGLKKSGGSESTPLQFKSAKRKSTSEVELELPKKATPKKRAKKVVTTDDTSPNESLKENTVAKKKATPAKRTRRVNTLPAVIPKEDVVNESDEVVPDKTESNSPVMNKEMKRMKELIANKNSKKAVEKKTRTRRKPNRSMDDIEEDQQEVLPVSKRALAKRALL